MRRSHVSILVLVLAFGLAATVPPVGASLQKVPSSPGYRGLIRNPDGPCGPSLFQLAGGAPVLCTHGPDPVPTGVVAHGNASVALMQARAGGRPNEVPCVDNGLSGDRVQAIYVRATGQPDRLGSLLLSLQTYAADVEATVEQSAVAAGGQRVFRWVTTSSGGTCQPSFLDLEVPASDIGDFSAMRTDLKAQGYNLPTRKYLVWVDYPGPMQNDTYCGFGSTFPDDRADPNVNNNNGLAAQFAGIQPKCWGLRSTALNGSVESHELMHTLGAVQNSAPHSTGAGHCTDDYDVMCYQDTSGIAPTIVCPNQSSEDLYDCNFDDYFNPNPTGSNYLVNHWNTANSSWMMDPQHATHQLSVTFAGAGSGTVSGSGLNCTASCSSNFAEGTKIQLSASPNAGSTFTNWSGACSGTGACNVTMGTSDMAVTATFGVRPQFQPDMKIGTSPSSLIGDNVYNGTGLKQTQSLKGARGAKKTFYFQLENDGAATDTITVNIPSNPKGLALRYFQGSSGFNGPTRLVYRSLPSGFRGVVIKIVVTILSTAKRGASISLSFLATSAQGPQDVVKAKVTVA